MDLYKADAFIKTVRPYLLLNISLKVLRYMGTWAPEQKGIFRYLFFVHCFCILIFTLGIIFCVEIVDIVLNWGDLAKIASGAPLFLTNFAYALKLIAVTRNRKKIQDLLLIVEGPIFTKNNSRYERIIKCYTWQNMFHNGVYQILGLLTVIFWTCIPITILLDGNDKQLPLNGWYPYDTTKTVAFILTWLHQGVAIIIGCINNLAIDALISSLFNVASCQFELLKWNIASIGNIEIQKLYASSEERIDESVHYKNISEELRFCIEHNLAIFDFIREVQKMFSAAIGFQLFVNCFVTCLSTFYISQLTTVIPAEIIGTSAYIFCMTYQSFIYCWSGNELFLQNENLSMAVYMGNWCELKARYQRDLHIIMLRTHRPLILSTAFLMKLSISTFMSIIQMSYSIFMLLHRKNA